MTWGVGVRIVAPMPDPRAPAPMPTVPGCTGSPPVPMPYVGPGPGPRPVEPVFPFAEARAALRTLDEVIDDVGTLSVRSQTLTYGLLTDGSFHGSARDRFESTMDDANEQLVPISTSALETDRDWLVQAIATARIRQDDYEHDLAAWKFRRDHPNPTVAV